MDTWGTILQTIGLGGVGMATVGWLVKTIVNSLLSKDVETFKANLIAQNSKENERFKHELQRNLLEHQAKFNLLHQERAQKIAELYRRLSISDNLLQNFVSAFGDVEQKRTEIQDQLCKSLQDLYEYFDPNMIYLNPSICEKIENFLRKTNSIRVDFDTVLNFRPEDEEYKTRTRSWHEITKKAKEEVSPIRKELENLFRELLGVDQEKKCEMIKISNNECT